MLGPGVVPRLFAFNGEGIMYPYMPIVPVNVIRDRFGVNPRYHAQTFVGANKVSNVVYTETMEITIVMPVNLSVDLSMRLFVHKFRKELIKRNWPIR